ncbi:MAG: UDP-N-acetylmuramoylalanine--D-glutamate [Desulfobulbaceae bacterium]|nr:MAG: UDP-N-acetylmuramoylalanine--D-glutamate [Desulfobulbaceae bacterium]
MTDGSNIKMAKQHVAVMGLGVSGRAALRYLVSQGTRVSVSEAGQLQASDLGFLAEQGVEYEIGGHTLSFLQQADAVLVSPGISWDLEILEELRARGIAVQGELGMAASLLQKPVVAITGTNGKTTVTALVGELLTGAGKKVFVGGNIGTSLFDYLMHPEGVDVLVLELSSFQLEAAGDFKANVALLLNVTPDHLDRHGNMAGYAAAKMKIFAGQGPEDTAIVSGDDSLCRDLLKQLGPQRQLLFGHGDDCQAKIVGHAVQVEWQGRTEHYDLTGTMLDTATGHLNSAAAVLAARALDCSPESIARSLAAFQVAAHRMALVGAGAGVTYYDDSKATNTGAVLSALDNFSGNVILIAGGRDKGDDYTLLRASLQKKVRLLILIGEAGDLIARAVDGATEIRRATSMDEAVMLAASVARGGDTVLLSPACSSFDMFENYGHRGRAFAAAARTVLDRVRKADDGSVGAAVKSVPTR